jgi:flagellar hook-length control protein FliK
MTPLPMPTALAPRATTAQAATPSPESQSDSAGFAAALELAREPADAAEPCRVEVDADASAIDAGTIDGGERADAADPATPELSALLPGWPPAALPIAAPAANAATAAAQDGAADPGAGLDAVALSKRLAAFPGGQGERNAGNEGPRGGEAAPAPSAAEPMAALTHTPASLRAAATQATDALAAPSAVKSEAASIAAPTLNTTNAQVLALGTAPGMSAFTGSVNAATANTAAAPFEAQLAAAIDSAAFAPALANQVTWLAGEGVQQARIHLNPAEMGPLSVKIVLDGSQARIDFSADLVATRNAIEASLPTLAAALNDQGLTLAGGGVFDGQARHGTPRERPAQGAGANNGAALSPRMPDGPAGTQALRSARGLVDLVA